MYTEEMTRLFRHADPAMPEDKKVRLLMRGVKQELFAGLVRNPPTTVQDFLSEATTIEKALDMRNRQYNRRSMPQYAEVQGLSHDLRDTIRAIVREVLSRLLLGGVLISRRDDSRIVVIVGGGGSSALHRTATAPPSAAAFSFPGKGWEIDPE